MKNYLPNGSVVLLKNSDHRVMILGRVQRDKATGRVFDYSGCYYPEGMQDSGDILLFNDDDIRLVFFIGFQDFEELAYRDALIKAVEEHNK